ncbi:Alb1-domain-containing protein [Bombardia bombarda]|uniref:Alb1-domain-containing protein n=1 Tax=Bombardia bombarda TaxID=252184 RepID=A0AA39XKQ9_9PEZI|nr:Alb1-domain-containing protein [Bombardia bombarda]
MAAKVKVKSGPSAHSRAARRATSPGIDIDKSLKHVKPPVAVESRPNVLAARLGGVTKQKSHKPVMSSKAAKRHAKNMDRAEAIMDRTEKKVQKSKGQARTIQTRRKTWEEINKQAYGATLGVEGITAPVAKKSKAQTEEDEAVAAFYGDDDEEMVEAGEETDTETAPTTTIAAAVAAAPVQLASIHEPTPGEDDEIL